MIEITERSVVLRQRDGARAHVPNVEVLSKDRRSIIELQLAIETDLDHVEHVIRTALREVKEINQVGSVWATSLQNVVDRVLASVGPRCPATGHRCGDPIAPTAVASAGIHPVPAVSVQLVESDRPIARARHAFDDHVMHTR